MNDNIQKIKANVFGLGSSYKIIKNEYNDNITYSLISIPCVEVPDSPVKKYGIKKFIFNGLKYTELNKIINSNYVTATLSISDDSSVIKCTLEDYDDNVSLWVATIKGCGYIPPMNIDSIDSNNISSVKHALSIAYNKSPRLFEAVLLFKADDILILNNNRYIFKPNEHNYFQMM